jgi:hypothetical protein
LHAFHQQIEETLHSTNIGVLSLCRGREAYSIPLAHHYENDRLYFRLGYTSNSKMMTFLETTDNVCYLICETSPTNDPEELKSWSVIVTGRMRTLPPDERARFDETELNALFPPIRVFDTPLVVFAGEELGTGSSRDWAAKGTDLLGVRATIAESYERIFRDNLVGMGVLPLQFQEGDSWESLGLDGSEIIAIRGLDNGLDVNDELTVLAERADGSTVEFPVLPRLVRLQLFDTSKTEASSTSSSDGYSPKNSDTSPLLRSNSRQLEDCRM